MIIDKGVNSFWINSFTGIWLWMMMEKEFSTKRLFLRRLTREDFSFLHTLWAASSGKEDYLAADSQRVFAVMESLRAAKSGLFWAVCKKKEGHVIGTCELNKLDLAGGYGEVGCELGESFRAQGYMTEALTALLDFSFSDLSLSRLAARIKVDNHSSVRLFMRLGFSASSEITEAGEKSALQKFSLCSQKYFDG